LWLFPGCEMATLGEPTVMNEFGIRFLCPAPRCRIDLVGEGAHRDGDLDASHVEETTGWEVRVVPVESRRRERGVGQPIERDIVEHIVLGQPLRLSIEYAADHLLGARVMINHPGCEADG